MCAAPSVRGQGRECVVRRLTGTVLCGLVLLVGCTARGGAPTAHSTAAQTSSADTNSAASGSAPPRVGSCATIDRTGAFDALSSPAPTDCAAPHNAEVMYVANAALASVDHYPTAGDVAQVVSTAGQTLERICNSDALLFQYMTGRNDQGYPHVFAHIATFLPSARQWASGARWMECDVFYGVRFPQTSPGRLAGALSRNDSAVYRLCMTGPPSSYVFTPCSHQHVAEAAGDTVEAAAGTPYPQSRAARQILAQQCSESVLSDMGGALPTGYVTDFYPVRREAWPDSPFGSCALVRRDGAATTTSVHDQRTG
jgi:hypothetical protein